MDLKEFIKETICSIVDATKELQQQYEPDDVLLNPPVAQSGSEVYSPGSENYVYRKIVSIEFDVALTVGSEAGGKAGASIKVFSAQIGAGGHGTKSTETVSRIQFSIPIALSPTSAEAANRSKREEKLLRDRAALEQSLASKERWIP